MSLENDMIEVVRLQRRRRVLRIASLSFTWSYPFAYSNIISFGFNIQVVSRKGENPEIYKTLQ